MESFNALLSVTKPANLLLPPLSRISTLPKPSSIRASNHGAATIKSNSIVPNLRHSTNPYPNPDISRVSNPPPSKSKPRVSDITTELRTEAEKTLEWPAVCSQLSAFVFTAAGRSICQEARIPIGRDLRESQKLLDQTAAAVLLGEVLDFSGVDDVSEMVRLAVAGEMLTVRELCAVERSLRSARRVFEQLEQASLSGGSPERYSPLLDILQDCDFLTGLADRIGFCIDCTLSVVLDRASSKLESIRTKRRGNMERLDSVLKEISAKVFQAGGIGSPLVTKRRSRMCVAIKASHKSLLREGIVLGVSSSGATYFVEPRDAVELNNMEVRLLNSEKAEELAILGFLTSEIAGSEEKIKHLMEKIVELDLATARGAHARWMNSVLPVFSGGVGLNPNGNENFFSVDIEGIQHPLLLEPSLRSLSSASVPEAGNSNNLNRRDKMIVPEVFPEIATPVPVDIKIQHATKVVVISGPNTGGKTATMKTLGLASLMSKAGIFLPAKGRPCLPWFDQILTDIGDRQSLEHNLSTFSGHISRLCKIIQVTTKESLVLIDEIGSGTDPSEGVALSTSILQHLAACVNLAVVTTHYADLSCLKATDSRFENAAMEFCMKTLQPTYRVLWGSTGNSNALSIAKSIGFDQKVLDRAHEWVEKLLPDKQKERQGSLYQSLLEERNLLEAQAREAASVLSEVTKLHLQISSEAEDLDSREAALKAKESQLVQHELKTVQFRMDAVIMDFENKLQSATLDQFNSILREAEAAIASIVAANRPSLDMVGEININSSYVPQIGDEVYVRGLGDKLATVVEAPAEDGTTMIRYGKIKVRAKRNDMKPIQSIMKDTPSGSASYSKRQEQGRYRKRDLMAANEVEDTSFEPAVKMSKNTVDLRGMRVEEASDRLLMAISGCRSYGVLFVVHGMGTGAVKQRALDILRKHPRVAKFEEESPMNYGCTIAYIK